MNTKILVSLLVIGLTAIAIGGSMTGAFFSDSETSTQNTFAAGAIDLKIDSECKYNGVVNQACTWESTDLTTQKFFNYADLKPGDFGEDTISIDVDTNEAWGCVTLTQTSDADVSCVEPEVDAEPNCALDLTSGELGDNLNFFIWADSCGTSPAVKGDNIYQEGCDIPLTSGPASDISLTGTTYALADKDENNVGAANGQKLDPSKTYYLGVAWCLGTIDTTTLACNGNAVTNAVQTDKYTADISFNVVQARNNDNFQC
jgi:predicted ribosomally synthesized peptide with SipW-like signal peptide